MKQSIYPERSQDVADLFAEAAPRSVLVVPIDVAKKEHVVRQRRELPVSGASVSLTRLPAVDSPIARRGGEMWPGSAPGRRIGPYASAWL